MTVNSKTVIRPRYYNCLYKIFKEDGTWTDVPRCIEHEPGEPKQVTDGCPGVPGYCSLDYPGGVCEFDCLNGTDIRSECTEDGTWDPYPTCDGDIREKKDGCDPCPGPFGGPRDRKAEAKAGNKNRENIRVSIFFIVSFL